MKEHKHSNISETIDYLLTFDWWGGRREGSKAKASSRTTSSTTTTSISKAKPVIMQGIYFINFKFFMIV